jgi:predicted enzyme related to lactoylglutathione lyase
MSENRVVHFEIPAIEPKALAKFYSDLFGWKFQLDPIPGVEYWSCETGTDGPGSNGAIMKRQNAGQPWMNYVDAASIDAALETAVKLGAKGCAAKNAGCRTWVRSRQSWIRKGISAVFGSRRRGRFGAAPYGQADKKWLYQCCTEGQLFNLKHINRTSPLSLLPV